MNNIIAARKVDELYPKYKPHGKVSDHQLNEIKQKVYGLVTNKLGGVILRSADSIVISSFLGLSILAIYQNYYFILTGVIGIIAIVFEGCMAGIGNSLITENSKKNFYDLKTMTLITCWVSAICCCGFLALYQPFISLWVGEEYLMEYSLVESLVVYFYIYEIDSLISTFKDAAGMWYKDRYRPLITALVNLMLNIIMVQHVGLYGVLYSTVISMAFVGVPWLIYNVFTTIFEKRDLYEYFLFLFKCTIIVALSSFIVVLLLNKIHLRVLMQFIVGGLISIIVPSIIFIIVYSKSEEFSRVIIITERILVNIQLWYRSKLPTQ